MNSEEHEEAGKVAKVPNANFMRTISDTSTLKQRGFFNGLKLGIKCPNFSTNDGNDYSDQPFSSASFSGHGGI